MIPRAFTLFELVAVLVVVTILAATAAPALNSIANTRHAAASRQLLRDMTYARQHAQATGTRAWVVFDVSDQTWSILGEDPENPGRANASVMVDPGTGAPLTRALGEGAYVAVSLVAASFDGSSEVGFDWLGRPLNAGEAMLAAQGLVTLSGGHVVSVEVGTGHVMK